MKKIILLGAIIWNIFPVLLGSPVETVSTVKAQSTNALPLKKTNYDSLLKENVVLKAAGDFENFNGEQGSTDRILQGFFSDEDTGIIRKANRILGALGILYLVVLGIKYVFNHGEDEKIERYKKELIWIIVGLMIISAAEFIGFEVFNPNEKDILSDEIVAPLDLKIHQIIRFIEYSLGGFFLVNMILTGYYMLTSAGGEERLQKEKNFIQSFLLGSAFILFGEVTVRLVGEDSSSIEKATIINTEIGGIVNFILTFMAGAAAFMLVLASIYYVANFGNEEQVQQAKKVIIACVFGLALAFSGYVIAQFMII